MVVFAYSNDHFLNRSKKIKIHAYAAITAGSKQIFATFMTYMEVS